MKAIITRSSGWLSILHSFQRERNRHWDVKRYYNPSKVPNKVVIVLSYRERTSVSRVPPYSVNFNANEKGKRFSKADTGALNEIEPF